MIVICISSVQMVNCSVLNEGGTGSGSQGKNHNFSCENC